MLSRDFACVQAVLGKHNLNMHSKRFRLNKICTADRINGFTFIYFYFIIYLYINIFVYRPNKIFTANRTNGFTFIYFYFIIYL